MNKFLSPLLIAVMAAVGLTSPAQAKLLPSFSLLYANKHATHVVVVDAGGVVVESWRGDLARGDKLPFPADKTPVTVDTPPLTPRDTKIAAVTGSRRVLFLTRGKGGEAWAPVSFPRPNARLATVWVEDGQCFAIYQFMNPGPAGMYSLHMEERQIREEVLIGNFESVQLVEGKGQNPALLYLVLTQPKADPSKLNELVVRYANAAVRVAAEHKFEGAVKGDVKPRYNGNVVFLVRPSRDDRRGFMSGFRVEQLREIGAAAPDAALRLAGSHAWSFATIPEGK